MKRHIPILITVIITIVILLAATIGMIKLMDLPIAIPKLHENSLATDFSYQNDLMEQWENVRIYEVSERHETIEDLLETIDDEDITPSEFYDTFPEIDKNTLDKYLADNNEIEIDTGKLFIDKVDIDNTATGIKTISGKDILAIDEFNKIIILGETTSAGDKIKVAIIKEPKQLDFSVVKDLRYWNMIEEHAKQEQAILAVNANSYNWNKTGDYGIVYGAIKYHDTLIRKVMNNNQLIGFSKDGELTVGKSVDINEAYNVTEYRSPLIENNQLNEEASLNGKLARTGIGQTESGDIIIVNIAGGMDVQNNKGATENELALILQEYGAVNASELSNGNKAIMYWNGRVINNTFGYNAHGIKLPTAMVVKPATLIK